MAIAELERPLFSGSECELLEPRECLALPTWAERYRFITSGPAVGSSTEPVPWSNTLDPLNVTVMQALDDPRWSRVCFMGSPQTAGKTEVAVNFALSTLHQRGANVFYHNASAIAAQDVWRKKIGPALLASEVLARLIPPDREDGRTKDRRDFTNGTSLFIRGSESRAALAQATAMVTISDDVQAMGRLPEGDFPTDLAEERADSYPAEERRHLHLGQPGVVTDYLSIELFGSTFYVPVVPCLKCRTYQLIEWDRMVFDADPASARHDTWMRCANPDCDHHIRHDELSEMLVDYRWVSMPPDVNWITNPMEGGTWVDLVSAAVYPESERKTTICGFWRSALYWPFADWGTLAVKAIDAEGHPEQKINFDKRIRAIPHKEPEVDEAKITEEEIATHRSEGYAAGVVPDAADVVTVQVDVQSGYVYWLVRAWRKSDGTSWLIDLGTKGQPVSHKRAGSYESQRITGITRGLDEVDAVVRHGWDRVTPEGEVVGHIHAAVGLVDRGFERAVIGSWWEAKHRGFWFMIKGAKSESITSLWPIKPKLDDRGRPWRDIDVNQGKHIVRGLCRIAPGEPGYWHMPAEGIHKNTLRAYYKHMASERFDRTGAVPRWEKIQGVQRNDFWDCEVYGIAAAIACGVRLPTMTPCPEPSPAPPRARRPHKTGSWVPQRSNEPRRRSGWMKGR